MRLPDRLSALVAKVEAGQALTPDDLQRTALLQYLDLARLGEDFAREVMAADDALTKALAEHQP